MRNALTTIGFLVALPAGIALADEDCAVPMADWKPRSAVAEMAQAEGWTIRRIKIDDGCYEINGRDSAGRRIEVKVDPATLKIIEMEYEDDHHREDAQDN